MGADTLAHTLTTRGSTHVMSCDATIVVTTDATQRLDSAQMVRDAAARLGQLEQRWSRFLPTSELSGLNEAHGEPRRVSSDTRRLIDKMVQAWRLTKGAFDPTLVGALVELGYAASREDATQHTSLAPDICASGRPDLIVIDADEDVIQLPPGTALDPGGLGKGLAADIVVTELLEAGALGAMVEIGGDLRVAGRPPEGAAWPIELRGTELVLDVADGGIATSSSRLRTWTQGDVQRHHLIDPRTLTSADGDVVSCTVIAGSATTAETFTKLAFVDGAASALASYAEHGLAALITSLDGAGGVVGAATPAWNRFVR